MPGWDIVVVGASAGGVEALTQLVGQVPADLPAAVFVVLHLPASARSLLPEILSRAGALPAHQATNGETIRRGQIYVAPPDYHLLVKRGRATVARAPKENGSRPAVDPLFRSAALAYGRRVIGVVLTGSLDDGTAGLAVIKDRGASRSSRTQTRRCTRACRRARSRTWTSITACRSPRWARCLPAWSGSK